MRISVCIATYNGAKYIKEQLDSILSQLGDDDEVIISDDGSTDETLSIIREINDSRIKLLHHQKTRRKHKYSNNHYLVTANFENALRKAKGDYIFLSDQDDIWYPNKVQRMMEVLQSADYVISNRSYMDANDVEYQESSFPKDYLSRGLWHNLFINGFPGCHTAFSRRLLEASLPFPHGICVHDAWIARLALLSGMKMVYIYEPLIKYRIHDSNTSGLNQPRNPLWFRISYRFIILWHVIWRSILVRIKSAFQLRHRKKVN